MLSGDKSSPKYGSAIEGFSTAAQADDQCAYSSESDQKGTGTNTEASDVLDIPSTSTPPPLPEEEAPKVWDPYLKNIVIQMSQEKAFKSYEGYFLLNVVCLQLLHYSAGRSLV